MAAYNKFAQFAADLANGKHNLGGDTLKVMLSNVAPAAANAVLTDLTEITAANGYTAGGTAATTTSDTQSGGTDKLILGNVVFTASGGTIGPFRYAALYNATQTSPAHPLIGWWDYGSSVTLNSGDTFTWTPDAVAGVLQIA
ncbi:MAG: hypothetical protein ACREQ5_32460 [Candidatus Dormibacteria bacterium]